MRRTTLALLAVLAACSVPALAQQSAAPSGSPAAALTQMASSADVAALVAKARAARQPDQMLSVQRLLELAPYRVNIEYRVGAANAAVHEHEAELFVVLDGAGTLVTGGTLSAARRTNAENLTGTGIDNGTSRRVAKGDVILVPENTPHWFNKVDGSLTLMSLHLPRPAAR
jgi:mannose-6-phosphate isomerase-like protein (cupin superfamily)